MKKAVVVRSIEAVGGQVCVDLRQEPGGGYSWVECRRDPEDGHGWRHLGVPRAGFDSAAAALGDARAAVGWMGA